MFGPASCIVKSSFLPGPGGDATFEKLGSTTTVSVIASTKPSLVEASLYLGNLPSKSAAALHPNPVRIYNEVK